MDPHTIELAKEIVLGNDALSRIPQVLRKMGMKGPALLLSGPTTFEVAGADVKEILESAGFSVKKEVTSEVTREELERIKKESENFKFVLGVGGGRIIDTAKYIGTEKNVSYFSVPTAPSHDGIASSRATITEEERKYSYSADSPSAIIADLEVINNAPADLISAGCGDLISNITAVEDWKLGEKDRGEYYSDYAAALSVLAAEIVMSSAEEIKNREERGMRNLVKALISAGIAMSIAGSSRPCSGAEHQFSHALDYIAEEPGHHGNQCAMGTLLSAYEHGMDWKNLKLTMEKLDVPTSIDEVPFTREEAFRAWKEAVNIRDRYTVLDKIGTKEPENLFKDVGII